MKIIETNNFKLYPETRVTFIDQTKKTCWPVWKKGNECTDKEKKEINLREIFSDEIILDYETKDNYEMIKNRLINDG